MNVSYLKNSHIKYLLCISLLLILFLIDILIGNVYISPTDIFKTLFTSSSENWIKTIIDFRLTKSITAIWIGIGLSISGIQMQTFFRNPLASPFVLGISAGASLGVVLLLLVSHYFPIFYNSWTLTIASMIGATGVLCLVLATSHKLEDTNILLIIGLMIGTLIGALITIIQYFSNITQIQNFFIWNLGSLANLSWSKIMVLSVNCTIGIAIAVAMAKPLNIFLLGETYAATLGINVKKVRFWLIVSTSILAGSITAFCGPIAFVGIAVPYMAKLLFAVTDHKKLLIQCALIGACFLLTCDIISNITSPQPLPINVITSLIGTPIVIALLLRNKK